MSEETEYDVHFQFPSFLVHVKECSMQQFPTLEERSARMYEIVEEGRKLDKFIDASDLFSPNDLIDDVTTASLKFLLVPFILAEFLLETPAGYTSREQILKEATTLFKKFIDRLDLLFLVTPEARALLNGEVKEGPNELRKRRIQERLRENELLPKYEYLQHKWIASCVELLKKQDKNKIVSLSAEQYSGQSEDGVIHDEREIILEWFDRCIHKVVDHQRMIKQELDILAFHNKEQEKRDMMYKHGQTAVDVTIAPLSDQKKREEHQQETAAAAAANVQVSTSGVSTGGLKVHSLETSDDAKRPIPQHMAEYMVRAQTGGSDSKSASSGAPGHHHHHHHHHAHSGECNHPHHEHNMRAAEIERQHQKMQRTQGFTSDAPADHVCTHLCRDGKHAHIYQPPVKPIKKKDLMTDDERLAKPWFNPNAGTSTACSDGCGGGLHWEDVTLMPELPEYTLSKIRGKSGQLVKTCPVHRVAVSTCGCDNSNDIVLRDRINTYVDLRVDRTRVFRDRNPYLMELDDWAKMKIDSGELPGEKDQQLAERIKSEEQRHRMRVEAGESDDEDQLKSEQQLRDEEEEAQMKARQWADWTDDHQKGAGNKKYRK